MSCKTAGFGWSKVSNKWYIYFEINAKINVYLFIKKINKSIKIVSFEICIRHFFFSEIENSIYFGFLVLFSVLWFCFIANMLLFHTAKPSNTVSSFAMQKCCVSHLWLICQTWLRSHPCQNIQCLLLFFS